MAPANGCVAPQSRFWIAMANEKVSRPQPWPNDIGVRNWPSAERGPNAISAMAQPTAISTAGVRQGASFSGADAGAGDKQRSGISAPNRRDATILSRSDRRAKAKVRDAFDLRRTW